jgi:hypothetical protein
MLEALLDISQPGPSGSSKSGIKPLDITTSADSLTLQGQEEEKENDDGVNTPTSAAWSYTSTGTTGTSGDGEAAEGTEDEMDSEEDAVLLKRPEEGAAGRAKTGEVV